MIIHSDRSLILPSKPEGTFLGRLGDWEMLPAGGPGLHVAAPFNTADSVPS